MRVELGVASLWHQRDAEDVPPMRITRRGIQLFRAFDIEVQLDYSWFIFFSLVTWSVGALYLPRAWPEFGPVVRWLAAIAAAVLVFGSVLFHEMSHAIVSNRLGFPIRRITLFIFGGVAHMSSEPKDPRTEFRVAAAGPLSSLALWLLFYVAAIATGMAEPMLSPLYAVTTLVAQTNLYLAIFNLVPGFPLDGGRLLRAGLWWKFGDIKRATNISAKGGELFAWFLMALGVVNFFLGGGWVYGVWYLLIGVFLKGAAEQSYQHVLMEEVLEGIQTREIMGSNVMSVREDEPVERLVKEKFLQHKFTAYPVLNSEGFVVGVIDLKGIRGLSATEREAASVEQVMHLVPLSHLPRPETDAFTVFREMLSLGVDQLPVIDGDGRLAGIVTRSDIMSMFQIRSDLAGELVR